MRTIFRVCVGAVVLWGATAVGGEDRALVFPGGDGMAVVVADEVLPLPAGAFTVEAWVNPRETPEHASIVSKAEKSGFVLSIKAGLARFKIHSGEEYRKVEAGAPLGNDRWTHMAGVWDGSEVRLYLAGHLVARAPAPGPMTRTTLPLMVGADPDAEGKAQLGFDGKMDEVRLSAGVRYVGARFEPQERFERDAETLLLWHCDAVEGGRVRSDDEAGRHGVVLGEIGVTR